MNISVLNRYILKAWGIPFLSIFILVNTIFLIRKITIWLPKLIEHDAPWDVTIMLFASMMPLDLTLTIPIAFFFALIKLVLDLQTSSELDAMYAGGRSIFNIFVPVLWAGVFLTLIMLALTMEISPAGKVLTYNTSAKLSSLKAAPTFEPKKFINEIEGLVFYFEGKNPDGSFAHFMLTDSRDSQSEPVIYFSNRAVISRIDSGLAVRLYAGSQLMGKEEHVRSISFDHYDIAIPLELEDRYYTVNANQNPSFMGTKALFDSLFTDKVSASYVAHWNFRLVLSLSVLLLFFFAIPLALRNKRSKQSGVFLISLIVMWLINQIELVLFKKIGASLLPWWSIWLALLFFTFIGLWMFYQVHRKGVFSFNFLPKK
jgi:lipopolysaccharide export system permease protein